MPLLDKLREQYGVGLLRQASAYFAKAEFDRLWKK